VQATKGYAAGPIDQETIRNSVPEPPTDGCQPIELLLLMNETRYANWTGGIVRGLDIGARDIGFDAKYYSSALPIVAELPAPDKSR
jgi:hypothetical protein